MRLSPIMCTFHFTGLRFVEDIGSSLDLLSFSGVEVKAGANVTHLGLVCLLFPLRSFLAGLIGFVGVGVTVTGVDVVVGGVVVIVGGVVGVCLILLLAAAVFLVGGGLAECKFTDEVN